MFPLDAPSLAKRHTILVLGVCLVVAVPLFSAWMTGSVHLPQGDDWVYLRIVFDLAQTGKLTLLRYNDMILLGNFAWALPVIEIFGYSIAALATATWAIGCIGLVASHQVARRLLDPAPALLVVFLVGISPGFAINSTSFMTDVPAFTAQAVCLWLALIALDRLERQKRWLSWLAASLAVGFYGGSIREFAIAAPLAVLVAFGRVEMKTHRFPIWSVLGGVVIGAASASLYLFRHSIPLGNSPYQTEIEISRAFFTSIHGLVTFGLAVFPLALLVAARAEKRSGRSFNTGTVVVFALVLIAVLNHGFFLGNQLSPKGAMANEALSGNRPNLFPSYLWVFVMACALRGASIVGGELWRQLGSWKPRNSELVKLTHPAVLLLVTYLLLATGSLVFRASSGVVFERYLLPVVLAGSILLMRNVPVLPRPSFIAALVVVAFVSMAAVVGSNTYAAARWEAGEQLRAVLAVRPDQVDAGLEWVGFHASGPVEIAVKPVSVGGPLYLQLFPASGNCGVVSSSQLLMSAAGDRQMGTVEYQQLLGLKKERLWLYRNSAACG